MNVLYSGCRRINVIKVTLHTFSQCLPTPARTPHPCLHHIPGWPAWKLSAPSRLKYSNLLNLPCLTSTISHTLNTQIRRLKNHTSVPPHIHFTNIRFALYRLCRLSATIAHVKVPQINLIWTHALSRHFARYAAGPIVGVNTHVKNSWELPCLLKFGQLAGMVVWVTSMHFRRVA